MGTMYLTVKFYVVLTSFYLTVKDFTENIYVHFDIECVVRDSELTLVDLVLSPCGASSDEDLGDVNVEFSVDDFLRDNLMTFMKLFEKEN